MSSRHMKKDPWWHVAGLSLGLLFTLMLMSARLYPAYFEAIDSLVEMMLAQYQSLEHTQFFLAVTVLGNGPVIAGMTLASAYLLRRNSFAVLQLLLLMLFSSISMGIAKTFVERVRPEALVWLDPLNTYSFPSGHATLSTAFFSFIAVCLYRRIRNRLLRYIACFACILTTILVSFSRVVLNYHYLTDVIAGMLLGLFWLAVVHMIPRR